MSRGITNDVQQESEKRVVHPFLMAELLFDSDPLRAWNGVGTLPWDGRNWVGLGWLGNIERTRETRDLKAEGLAFELNGAPQELVSVARGTAYKNRLARLYMGYFDGNGIGEANIIASPFILNEGLMDVMDIEDTGETSTITVRAESRLRGLHRSREWLYTDEDQQTLYPGDRGFEYVAGLADKEIAWGVGVGRPNGPRIEKGRGPGRGPGSGSGFSGPGGGR